MAYRTFGDRTFGDVTLREGRLGMKYLKTEIRGFSPDKSNQRLNFLTPKLLIYTA
jgi:hypothetical protein